MPQLTEQKPPRGSWTRPGCLYLRCSPAELSIFHKVAAATGSSMAELCRVALLTEAVRLGLEVEPEHQHQEPEAVA